MKGHATAHGAPTWRISSSVRPEAHGKGCKEGVFTRNSSVSEVSAYIRKRYRKAFKALAK
jgi:hypothetical protein